jgi:hypothetical protein
MEFKTENFNLVILCYLHAHSLILWMQERKYRRKSIFNWKKRYFLGQIYAV